VYFPPTSGGIFGLYNLWRKPFYGLKEDSNHNGMKKAKDSSRCPMFPWFCKLLLTFYARLFKDCCSVDMPYLQGQASMESSSRPSLLRPQGCLYNGTKYSIQIFQDHSYLKVIYLIMHSEQFYLKNETMNDFTLWLFIYGSSQP
jgi:hypothetical protein